MCENVCVRSEGGVLRLLRGPHPHKGGGGVEGGVTWEPYPGTAVERGGGIERHWGGVNPHSPRPSLSGAGHNKPRPPPPASPRRPLTPRLRLLSLAPLCLHPVIICNIYSFWFPCWPLSSPTRHSWLTGKLKCSPSYSSITPETLKPSANTTWSGNESAYDHLFMAFWFRPQGAAQKSSSQWMSGVKGVLLQRRLVVKMHYM